MSVKHIPGWFRFGLPVLALVIVFYGLFYPIRIPISGPLGDDLDGYLDNVDEAHFFWCECLERNDLLLDELGSIRSERDAYKEQAAQCMSEKLGIRDNQKN